jgi:hypothetical protein
MAGLDPQTAMWLALGGIAATIAASLIALVSNLIGQRIQRGTARQVAQIQADAQAELDRRKAVRDYREQLIAPLRTVIARRYALWYDLAMAVEAGHSDLIDAGMERLSAEGLTHDLSYVGVLDREMAKPYGAYQTLEQETRRALEEALLGEPLEARVRAGECLRGQLTDLQGRTAALNRAIERYVLGPPASPSDGRLAPKGGAPPGTQAARRSEPSARTTSKGTEG